MLFGSTVLEVAIGMIFVYLLLSLLCSAISEYIESMLQNRAKDLEKGIRLLLNDSDGKGEDLAKKLYAHGLVRPLYRDLGKLPSYIPARTFALALWNMASSSGDGTTPDSPPGAAGDRDRLAKVRQVVANLPNQELRQALTTLIDEANGDFEKARKNIEDWYDGAMDRVSGWYKRRSHLMLLFIGFFAAALINADSINIGRALVQDGALRSSLVAAAEKRAAEPLPTTSPTPATPEEQAAAAKERMRVVRAELNELGLPLGWEDNHYDAQGQLTNANDLRRRPRNVDEFVLKFFGLLLTGLAISQGAPFWFDLLNKFMVIRSTVKPKEKSPDEASKDKTTPKPDNRGVEDKGDTDNPTG
jgi:hypothetical protein